MCPDQPRAGPTLRFLLAILAFVTSAHAAVPERWLDLIAEIESRRNPSAQGDRNAFGVARARGEFQFWKTAWTDTTRLRAAQGLLTWPYSASHNREEARAYARTWFTHLESRLRQTLGRQPTIGEIWAASNLGWSGFEDRGFRLSACPAPTRRKAAWLVAQVNQ